MNITDLIKERNRIDGEIAMINEGNARDAREKERAERALASNKEQVNLASIILGNDKELVAKMGIDSFWIKPENMPILLVVMTDPALSSRDYNSRAQAINERLAMLRMAMKQ
jgi:ethanolamine utilization microcompartment shell protein EutS